MRKYDPGVFGLINCSFKPKAFLISDFAYLPARAVWGYEVGSRTIDKQPR